MPRTLCAAAPSWAGIRHRFRSLSQAKTFAEYSGYRVYFLWGVSDGVAHCRFEELLASIPGVSIVNVPEREIIEVERVYRISKTISFRGQPFSVYSPGGPLSDKLFAFDLWGDLAATTSLRQRTPLPFRLAEPAHANPSAELRSTADAFIRRHDVTRRVGIRVRVTENRFDGRKPRRIQRELDHTVKSIIRMPWYVRIFVATDSEYIQQMLASHFPDARFLRKRFHEWAEGGRYVHRQDRSDMRTFMAEVRCLTACCRIINIGGFVNEESVRGRFIDPPYDHEVMADRRVVRRSIGSS